MTGMLVHGRHLDSPGWERMVWGDARIGKLGTLPTAILAILNEGVDNILVVTFGTGGSHSKSGMFESEVTKQLLLDRFDELETFTKIRMHPAWTDEKDRIRSLADSIVTDIVSQNTKEEIALAAKFFENKGVTRVVEITGASHGPRCELLQGIARDSGDIPDSQYWVLVTDDMPFTGSSVGDTAVIEAPHRGDDPLLRIPEDIRPGKLFPKVYAIPPEKREAFLEEVAELFKKYQ